ncbi:MAG TPA: holo-ACP synthase [Thermodesulfovibrionales bacterium]|nr:holo-ACP synthase [Thermodesulfovibrionales bacterium]
MGYKNWDMIHGIGIDIVRVVRIEEATKKWGRRFLEKVFTKDEIEYCYKKFSPYQSLAVRFAAKEAFIKAMGSGSSLSLTDIEVVNAETGKPSIRLNKKLEDLFTKHRIMNAHLSLSHERDYSVACVLLEQ